MRKNQEWFPPPPPHPQKEASSTVAKEEVRLTKGRLMMEEEERPAVPTMTPSLNPEKREQRLVSRPIPSIPVPVLPSSSFSSSAQSSLSISGSRKRSSHSCLCSHPLSFLRFKSIFSLPIPVMGGCSSSSTLTFIIQQMNWRVGDVASHPLTMT